MPGPRQDNECGHRWRKHVEQPDGSYKCTVQDCTCTNKPPFGSGPPAPTK